MGINVSISLGELLDKITILEIKYQKIEDIEKKTEYKTRIRFTK